MKRFIRVYGSGSVRHPGCSNFSLNLSGVCNNAAITVSGRCAAMLLQLLLRPLFLYQDNAKTTNYCRIHAVIARGGVEDTRLEAKAKDTKKSEAKTKDSLSEDRHSRGQGQECSRPRPIKDTSASALQKKRSSQKFFKRSPQKNVFQKNFNNSKNSAVLEPRTGQFSRT